MSSARSIDHSAALPSCCRAEEACLRALGELESSLLAKEQKLLSPSPGRALFLHSLLSLWEEAKGSEDDESLNASIFFSEDSTGSEDDSLALLRSGCLIL